MYSALARLPSGRTLLAGKIVFSNKRCMLDCTVRELTSEHAVVAIPNSTLVPVICELRVPGLAVSYMCEATSRSLYEIRLAILKSNLGPADQQRQQHHRGHERQRCPQCHGPRG